MKLKIESKGPVEITIEYPGNEPPEISSTGHLLVSQRQAPNCYRYEHHGPKKILAIKTVRAITGMGLKDAKGFVETPPHDINRELAQALHNSGALVLPTPS